MLNLVPIPATVPVWMVQLHVELGSDGRPSLGDDDVEPMVELLHRTDGVRSVAVVPLGAGLTVAVGVAAPDAAAALERARGLTVSCARYAGLGAAAVVRARVTPAPDAGAG
jgi:pantoate kinase